MCIIYISCISSPFPIQLCESFKEASPYCVECGALLNDRKYPPFVRHFGLQLLEHFVRLAHMLRHVYMYIAMVVFLQVILVLLSTKKAFFLHNFFSSNFERTFDYITLHNLNVVTVCQNFIKSRTRPLKIKKVMKYWRAKEKKDKKRFAKIIKICPSPPPPPPTLMQPSMGILTLPCPRVVKHSASTRRRIFTYQKSRLDESLPYLFLAAVNLHRTSLWGMVNLYLIMLIV